jgi:hypothetical protein
MFQQEAVIEEFTSGFSKSSFGYNQIQRCLQFTSKFTRMYNANNMYYDGIPLFVKIKDLIPQFEYTLSHGVLDDPNGHEYSTGVTSVKDMQKALANLLKSNYIILDTDVKDAMLQTFNIITRNKFKQ